MHDRDFEAKARLNDTNQEKYPDNPVRLMTELERAFQREVDRYEAMNGDDLILVIRSLTEQAELVHTKLHAANEGLSRKLGGAELEYKQVARELSKFR